MDRKVAYAILGAAMLTGTARTPAADAGWYFGATGGQSEVKDLSQDDLDAVALSALFGLDAFVVSGPTSTFDAEDTYASAFAGYRFSPYFAVEAGYAKLGKATYQATAVIDPFGPIPAAPIDFGIDFESKGFMVAGIGAIPLGKNFELHGKLGMYAGDTEITVTASGGGASESDKVSGNSQDVFYGVGAAFHVGDHFTISLDASQFKDVGDEEETGESDIDAVSLSFSFRL